MAFAGADVFAIKIEQSGGLFAAQRVAAIADAAGIELYGGTMPEGASQHGGVSASLCELRESAMGHRAVRAVAHHRRNPYAEILTQPLDTAISN